MRENILVLKENLAAWNGGDLYIVSNNTGKAPTVAVPLGQSVWFNPATNKSIDPATITKALYPRISFGVSVDTDGDGVADAIMKVAGDVIATNKIIAASAEPPRTGISNVKDLLFKCKPCGEAVSIQLLVTDDSTMNQFAFNRPAVWTYTVNVPCLGCETCSEEDVSMQVACALRDAIIGSKSDYDSPLENGGRIGAFPRHTPKVQVDILRDFSHEFCLTNVTSDCSNCVGLLPVTTFKIGGVNHTLTGTTSTVNGDSVTLYGQLNYIKYQIDAILAGRGSATIKETAGGCPTYSIIINTCEEHGVQLTIDGDLTDPCETTEPLTAITTNVDCLDCDNATTTSTTFLVGLRFTGDAVDMPCSDTFPPNPPKSYLTRKIDIMPVTGFESGTWYKREVQAAVLPENTGYQWRNRQYKQATGGAGREYNAFNMSFGPFHIPGNNDRAIASVSAKCKELYCSYMLSYNLPFTTGGIAPLSLVRVRTIVLIPSSFSTAITSFQTGVNNLITSAGGDVALASITCASDQDQDNDSTPYPDYNGLIQ